MATNKSRGKKKKRTETNKAQVVRVIVLIFLILLCLSNFELIGVVGRGIKWLFFGIFGAMVYLLPFYSGAHIIWRMSTKKADGHIRKKFALGYVLLALIDAFIQRVINVPEIKVSTPADIFLNSAVTKSGGGFIGGLITKALSPTLLAGTIIILLGLMTLCVLSILDFSYLYLNSSKGKKEPTAAQLKKEREAHMRMMEEERIARDHARRERELERESRIQAREERKERERARAHERELKRIEREKELLREQQEMNELMEGADRQRRYRETGERVDYSKLVRASMKKTGVGDFSIGKGTGSTPSVNVREQVSDIVTPTITKEAKPEPEPVEADIYSAYDETVTSQNPAEHRPERRQRRERTQVKRAEAEAVKVKPEPQKETAPVSRPQTPLVPESSDYEFPSLSLLDRGSERGNISQAENRETAALLLQTLETFGVKAELTDISCGPAVTRFEIQPPIGTKVSKIKSLSDEIKLNLAAEDIRIEAPIPGKPAIGIEIPNKSPSSVSLYELLESDAFRNSKSLVSFAVGEDITGNAVVADMAKMPHILIAGQTGSGKSVCINSLIMSVLYKARPDQVKMIMVDPKVVELSMYNGIPHLLFPVVTDPRKASGVLNWTVAEMEARYKKFEETGVKNIAGYNEAMRKSGDPEAVPMPQLLVIIDELADLMMVAKGDVETAICRLAQLARAAGIHLVIATQRPSVNVITGLIKANVPSKIAFAVPSGVDSRTILDMNGAEKLLGKGDMLFFPTGLSKPKRVQGAFVSDSEVIAVVDFLRERYETAESDEGEESTEDEQSTVQDGMVNDISDAFSLPKDDDRDELFEEAARFVIEKEKGSIGMLQRNFKIGFNRAGRIMDQLSEAGVVGPDIGTKPRQVLMTEEELEGIL